MDLPALIDIPPNRNIPEANPHQIEECCGSVLMPASIYEAIRAEILKLRSDILDLERKMGAPY